MSAENSIPKIEDLNPSELKERVINTQKSNPDISNEVTKSAQVEIEITSPTDQQPSVVDQQAIESKRLSALSKSLSQTSLNNAEKSISNSKTDLTPKVEESKANLDKVAPLPTEEPKKLNIKEMQKRLQESQSAPALEKAKLEPSGNVKSMQNRIILPGAQPITLGERPKTFAAASSPTTQNPSENQTPKELELEGITKRSEGNPENSKFMNQLNNKLIIPTGPSPPQMTSPAVDLPDIKVTTEKKTKGFLGMGKKTQAADPTEIALEDEEGKAIQEPETFHKYIENMESFKYDAIASWGLDFENQIFKITRGLANGTQLKALKWNAYYIQMTQGFIFCFQEPFTKKKPPKSVGIIDIRGAHVQKKNTKLGKEVITVYSDHGFQIYLSTEKPDLMQSLQDALTKNTTNYTESVVPTEISAYFPKKEVKKEVVGATKSSIYAAVKADEDAKKQKEEEEKIEEERKRKEEEQQQILQQQLLVNQSIRGKRQSIFTNRSQADEEPVIEEKEPVVFRVPLENLTTKKQRKIPLLVEKCIQIVEHKGTDVVGIYRLSGNSDDIKKIKQLLEDNSDSFPDPSNPLFLDVNNVTGILKLFLRQLPNPLVPYTDYNKFIDILSIFKLI